MNIYNGAGHAEETLINAGAVHVDTATPRGICLDCENMIKGSGVTTSSPFTGRLSRKRR